MYTQGIANTSKDYVRSPHRDHAGMFCEEIVLEITKLSAKTLVPNYVKPTRVYPKCQKPIMKIEKIFVLIFATTYCYGYAIISPIG